MVWIDKFIKSQVTNDNKIMSQKDGKKWIRTHTHTYTKVIFHSFIDSLIIFSISVTWRWEKESCLLLFILNEYLWCGLWNAMNRIFLNNATQNMSKTPKKNDLKKIKRYPEKCDPHPRSRCYVSFEPSKKNEIWLAITNEHRKKWEM